MSRTHVTDAGLAKLTNLAAARLGWAGGNRLVSGRGLKALTEFKSLTALDLSGCTLTDDDLTILERLPNLERLWLADIPLSDVGLVHVASLRKLRLLSLAGTKVSGNGIALLKALPELKWLDLSRTSVSGAGIKSLANLPNLSSLAVADCHLTAADVGEIQSLSGLEELDLSDNDTMGRPDVERWARSPALRKLWLPTYQLTDSDAAALAKLPTLGELAFADGKITGEGVGQLLKRLNQRHSLIICAIGADSKLSIQQLSEQDGGKAFDIIDFKLSDNPSLSKILYPELFPDEVDGNRPLPAAFLTRLKTSSYPPVGGRCGRRGGGGFPCRSVSRSRGPSRRRRARRADRATA